MAKLRDRVLGTTLAVLVIGAPLMYQRYRLTTQKRLRAVVSGKLYRSGQMTEDGFEQAVRDLGIRTVINVQNEIPDPDLRRSFLNGHTVSEQELCRRLGVRYVLLEPDLVPPSKVPPERPQVIEPFLALMDDPANYPILIHCKAGLHRTGVLVALYRMEYDGWTASAAIEELKDNGFGDAAATTANQYIKQYITTYPPRRCGRAGNVSDRSSPDDSGRLRSRLAWGSP
jgi:tyrosine-protein phosphatase SIW14